MPVYIQNYNPTIVGIPANKFDAKADAKVLRDAMKGVGTDEKAITKILTTRTNAQLQQVRKAYAELYDNKDLVRNIKDECGGKFEEAAVALLLPRADLDAQTLQQAMSGMGTNEDTLIEILCTRTSDQISEIIKSFDRMYDKSLEAIVKSETSGDLEKILTVILHCKRDRDSKEVNEKQAKADAEELYKSGEKKWGTDEKNLLNY